MSLALRTAAFVLATSLLFNTPTATAQRLSAELQALDAQLPGTLINDPSVIDWEAYGDISTENMVDDAIPGGGAALRVDVKTAGEFIYTAGLKLPLIKKAESGEDITIGFYARAVEARTPDGKGIVRIRFQKDEAPFPGFGEETLAIENEWRWYEVTANVEQTLRRKDGIVVIQFGRTKQTLEFGQVIIVKGATSIASEPSTAAAPTPAETPAPTTALPSQLEGLGTLLNDPSKANWHLEGDAGTIATLDNVAIFGTVATRFTITDPSSKPHGLFAAIPLTSAINEGDELLIAIAGRSQTEGGEEAQIAMRIEETKPPYDGFSDNQISLTNNWRLIRVKTKAAKSFGPGEGQLALHFGGASKTVDIGPVYVLRAD